MRIGILGGSFNPPHNGHVYIAREVRRRFSLDRVLFMVSGDPPHKSIAFGVDAKERLELTRAALAGEEGLIACDDEIRRGGVSYMADTLMGLYNGVDELHLIVGADMLKTLHQWSTRAITKQRGSLGGAMARAYAWRIFVGLIYRQPRYAAA